MRIILAGDHAAYFLKSHLVNWLKQQGHEIVDLGTHSEERSDYPDYAHPLAERLLAGEAQFGIAICGSGNGINMTVNKHAGIRSALCWNQELAGLARAHNDANVLALPARFISESEAEAMVETFLNTPFKGGRHLGRVNNINCS